MLRLNKGKVFFSCFCCLFQVRLGEVKVRFAPQVRKGIRIRLGEGGICAPRA